MQLLLRSAFHITMRMFFPILLKLDPDIIPCSMQYRRQTGNQKYHSNKTDVSGDRINMCCIKDYKKGNTDIKDLDQFIHHNSGTSLILKIFF